MIRERVAGEIRPANAKQSATLNNDEVNHSARRAIDMNLFIPSYAEAGSDGKTWLKITLEKVYCVQQVIWYFSTGASFLNWTCAKNNCSDCEGDHCDDFNLTVSTDGAAPDHLSLDLKCRFGDVVRLDRIVGGQLSVPEIAIIGKQYVCTNCKLPSQDMLTVFVRPSLSCLSLRLSSTLKN